MSIVFFQQQWEQRAKNNPKKRISKKIFLDRLVINRNRNKLSRILIVISFQVESFQGGSKPKNCHRLNNNKSNKTSFHEKQAKIFVRGAKKYFNHSEREEKKTFNQSIKTSWRSRWNDVVKSK